MTLEPIEPDGYAGRFGKPLFLSLWIRAWSSQYPEEVQPFSSCTQGLLEQLAKEVNLRPDGLVVDLGCGAGGVGLWLGRHAGCRVVGIDCSGAGIAIATERTVEWSLSGRAEFHVADFADTGLAADSADAVISVDALPFANDVDLALGEIRRLLRPGGRLVFTTREARANTERFECLGSAWSRALGRNGFSTIRVQQRPKVSSLWGAVYDQWLMHQEELREELGTDIVDRLLEEVEDVGPKLREARPWLLITAATES